jgi:hypothetical protein
LVPCGEVSRDLSGSAPKRQSTGIQRQILRMDSKVRCDGGYESAVKSA